MLTLKERQERIKILANEMAIGGPKLYESWLEMLSTQTDEYLLRRIYELHTRMAKGFDVYPDMPFSAYSGSSST